METEFNLSYSTYIKENWKRFLDDCFIIWNKTIDELNLFHNILNSINPSIQFTVEHSKSELPFLDILVKKIGKRISTDIFYKNTDTHQYLDFRSCHPSHTKRNIPFCLARRICTIVIDEEWRELRLSELHAYLKKQKYPEELINIGIEKAKAIPIAELRTTVSKTQDDDRTPFVSTHNPCHSNIFNVIKTNLPILYSDNNLKELFPEESFIRSKRQPLNLKRLLTRAKFDGDSPNTLQVKTCNDARCGMCPNMEVGTNVTLKNGKVITPNQNFDCKSQNLIYCIICEGCKESYIGQTGNSICERIRIHRQQINDPTTRKISLSSHLDTCGKGKYKVFPFYKMHSPDLIVRLSKEQYFIKLFKPKLNGYT